MQEIEEQIPSPCCAICQLDDNDVFCIGCLRTQAEIANWSTLDRDARLKVIAAIERRRQQYTNEGCE